MTASNHVVTGAFLGAVIVNPVVALPLAFAAHFVLDALPHLGLDSHTDKKFLYVLCADTGLAMAVLLTIVILQPNNWPVIVLSGIACASPDLMWLPRWLIEMKGKKPKAMGPIRRFHAKIQWAERETWWGLTSEIVWFCLMFGLLAKNLTVG